MKIIDIIDYTINKTKSLLNKLKIYGLASLCLFLGCLLLLKSCELNHAKNKVEKTRIPDTVFVNKPYKVIEIQKEFIERPVKVYVYKRDTVFRKEIEKSDIILGVDVKRKNIFSSMETIKIDKISPEGIIMSNEYQEPAMREIKIDELGNMQVKKKRFTKLKRIAGIVIVGAAGFIIGKEVSK
jgi:hypothetical protein